MELEAELRLFNSQKVELLKNHKGKYALIIRQELLGTFDTRQEAYKVGIDQRGNVAMLIMRIEEREETEALPAMSLGLIRANL